MYKDAVKPLDENGELSLWRLVVFHKKNNLRAFFNYSSYAFLALLASFIFTNSSARSQSVTVPSSTYRVADTTIYNLISSSGTTVSVSGLDPVKVVVSATAGTLKITTTTGLTAPTGYTSLQWSGTNEIGFEGSLSSVNNALATLQYLGSGSITVSPTSSSILYYSGTGNYYEFINTTRSWTAAQSDANGRTFGSSSGYLATVTSAAEFTYIKSKAGLANEIWLGGSDNLVEGEWRWKGGSENGQQFWQGAGSGSGGAAVGGMYTSWNGTAEPNDSSSNEDCLAILTSGLWNDYPCTRSVRYMVEYEGSGVSNSKSFAVAKLSSPITLSDVNKSLDDPPFTIINPTSLSSGAFTYSSSNTAVATVVGNTITIQGVGSTTITVNQASDSSYIAASTTALLTVSNPNDPLTAFEAIKASIEETSSDNVYKNSVEHMRSSELTLQEKLAFHAKILRAEPSTVTTNFTDYNIATNSDGLNMNSSGRYHQTDLVANAFRRRILLDAKSVFFKNQTTTTVVTGLLLYDLNIKEVTSQQFRFGFKNSEDKRPHTLNYNSQAKTFSLGSSISHNFGGDMFGGISADVLYSSTKSKYANTYATVTGEMKTYSLTTGAQVLGQYESDTPMTICKKWNWCQFVNSKFWVKPALNFSYSREYLINKKFDSLTSLGNTTVYPYITMPRVVRLTAQQELLYEGKTSWSGMQEFISLTPSYACEKLKTTSDKNKCALGVYSEFGLNHRNGQMLSKLYFNYENLNLGPRQEYGLMFKMKF